MDRDEFFQLRLSTTRGHPYTNCRPINILAAAQLDPAFSLNVLPIYGTACLLIELVLPLYAFKNSLKTVDLLSLKSSPLK